MLNMIGLHCEPCRYRSEYNIESYWKVVVVFQEWYGHRGSSGLRLSTSLTWFDFLCCEICGHIIIRELICLVRKLLIMTSKLGAYLKTIEATGTTDHTDLPNPNAHLNPNSNLALNRHENIAACCRGSDHAAQPNKTEHCVSFFGDVSMFVDNEVWN